MTAEILIPSLYNTYALGSLQCIKKAIVCFKGSVVADGLCLRYNPYADC